MTESFKKRVAQPPQIKKFSKHLKYKEERLQIIKPVSYKSLVIEDIDWS